MKPTLPATVRRRAVRMVKTQDVARPSGAKSKRRVEFKARLEWRLPEGVISTWRESMSSFLEKLAILSYKERARSLGVVYTRISHEILLRTAPSCFSRAPIRGTWQSSSLWVA